MADPLSTAATVFGVVGRGFTIAKGLYEIADGIGSAGEEVRIYADEIDAFSKVLHRVDVELEIFRSESTSPDASHLCRDLQNVVEVVLTVCKRVLEPLSQIQNTLRPLLVQYRDSPSKFRQLSLRVQWIFKTRSKLLFYREALRGQKGILDTALVLSIFQTTRNKTPQNIYVLKLSLENSLAAVNLNIRDASASASRLNAPDTPTRQIFYPRTETSKEPVYEVEEDYGLDEQFVGQLQNQLTISKKPGSLDDPGADTIGEDLTLLEAHIDDDLNSASPESARIIWDETNRIMLEVRRLARGGLRQLRDGAVAGMDGEFTGGQFERFGGDNTTINRSWASGITNSSRDSTTTTDAHSSSERLADIVYRESSNRGDLNPRSDNLGRNNPLITNPGRTDSGRTTTNATNSRGDYPGSKGPEGGTPRRSSPANPNLEDQQDPLEANSTSDNLTLHIYPDRDLEEDPFRKRPSTNILLVHPDGSRYEYNYQDACNCENMKQFISSTFATKEKSFKPKSDLTVATLFAIPVDSSWRTRSVSLTASSGKTLHSLSRRDAVAHGLFELVSGFDSIIMPTAWSTSIKVRDIFRLRFIGDAKHLNKVPQIGPGAGKKSLDNFYKLKQKNWFSR